MELGWLEDMGRDVERQAQLAKEFGDRAAGVEAKARSADGAVQVVVDSRGVPIDIQLTDEISGRRPQQIASEIMATLRKAQLRLSADLALLTEATFGAGSSMAYEVNEELTRRYGNFDAEREERR